MNTEQRIEETRTIAEIEKAVDEVVGALVKALFRVGVTNTQLSSALTLIAKERDDDSSEG